MEKHIRTYTGENVDVTYEAGRCIHVAECVKRLQTVFDTSRRPWILPDADSPDSIAETVLECPSGALHYERKDGGKSEPVQANNTIRPIKNGPLHVRGDFIIMNSAGEVLLQDTRAALCRCGGSANKPFCDNTHKAIDFVAPDTFADTEVITEVLDGGKLRIVPTTNGPLHIVGNFVVTNSKGEAVYQGTDEELCRCGGSSHKPFCDGTHQKIGFIAD